MVATAKFLKSYLPLLERNAIAVSVRYVSSTPDILDARLNDWLRRMQ